MAEISRYSPGWLSCCDHCRCMRYRRRVIGVRHSAGPQVFHRALLTHLETSKRAFGSASLLLSRRLVHLRGAQCSNGHGRIDFPWFHRWRYTYTYDSSSLSRLPETIFPSFCSMHATVPRCAPAIACIGRARSHVGPIAFGNNRGNRPARPSKIKPPLGGVA